MEYLILLIIVTGYLLYKVAAAPQGEPVYIKYDDDVRTNHNLEQEQRMRDIHFYQERAWIDNLNKDE